MPVQRNHLQSNTEVAALTWGEPLPGDLQPPYDVILCSDLVYSPASVQPLLSTLSALMGPDSTVLYACEFREGAGLEQLHQQLPAYHLKEQLVRTRGTPMHSICKCSCKQRCAILLLQECRVTSRLQELDVALEASSTPIGSL